MDNNEYNPAATTSSRNLCLTTTRGDLLKYLDEFERYTEKHAVLRNLVSTERRAQIQYEHNSRPHSVKRDIDFSENKSLKDKHQTQSQYYSTRQGTIMVSICTWLLAKEWNKTTGNLKKGDEVTGNGELSGEVVNTNSFWGKIIEVLDNNQ